MDIFARIKDDHEELKGLLSQISDTTDQAAKKRESLFGDLKTKLVTHAKVEEATFYEAMKQHGQGKMVMEGVNEHKIADSLLYELDAMPKDDAAWSAKFKAFKEALEHHIKEEEDAFFKAAQEAFDEDESEGLGEKFEERSEAVQPAITPIKAN